MSEPTEGLASSGPAQDAIPDPVDERAPFEPDGNVATVIYSHIADVQTRGALAMASRSWRDVSMLPGVAAEEARPGWSVKVADRPPPGRRRIDILGRGTDVRARGRG